MCRLTLGAFAFLIGALTLSLAHAEPPKPCQGSDLTQVDGLAAAEAARADDLINGDGLLWRIEKPGLAPPISSAPFTPPTSPRSKSPTAPRNRSPAPRSWRPSSAGRSMPSKKP